MNDTLKLKGYIRLKCVKSDGSVKWDTGWIRNTITNAGIGVLPDLVGSGLTGTEFGYIAVGTSNTTPAATDTALGAEITGSGLARATATVTKTTTTITNDTLQFYHEWTATATATVEEVGVFNDATAGTMLGRALTGTKTVDDGEKLQGTYKIVFS